MERRKLGRSDVEATVLTLGTWAIGGWMWGGQDDADALATIDRSIALGMTSIDTAPAYGFGHAEELVGQAIRGRREKVQIFTKYGLRWDGEEGEFFFQTQDAAGRPLRMHRNSRPKSVIEECERSLRRLGTDYIDLYQCHWRDHTTPLDETMGAIDRLLQQGKIRASGVSNYTVDEIKAADAAVPLASDQPPYSMVERTIEDNGVLDYAIRQQIALVVYSPLQRGLLTGKVTMDRQFPPGDHRAESPYFRPDNRRKVLDFLDDLRPIARAHDATLAQVVLNWTVHRMGITAALVGARTPAQAQENAAATEFELTAEEKGRIDERVGALMLTR